MKKISFLVLVGMMSCGSDKKNYTEQERDARVDSLFAIRLAEIERQVSEDLDRRKSIEIKVKVDSILEAAAGADKTDIKLKR